LIVAVYTRFVKGVFPPQALLGEKPRFSPLIREKSPLHFAPAAVSLLPLPPASGLPAAQMRTFLSIGLAFSAEIWYDIPAVSLYCL
jgi:hypothetical protein